MGGGGLLWIALAIGGIGWLCGLLLARPAPEERAVRLPRPFLFAAFLLPALVFLVTLPGSPPFASGQGFGRGFLLGGLGALLAAGGLRLLRPDGRLLPAGLAAIASACALAAVAATLPLLFLHTVVIDALVGVALGWFTVSALLTVGLEGGGAPAAGLPLLYGAGFAVTACALAALGLYREAIDRLPDAPWAAVGLTFAAGVPFLLLFSALPAWFARPDGERGAPTVLVGRVVAVVPLLGLAWLLSARGIADPRLLYVAGAGLLAGLVAWWLTAAEAGTVAEEPASSGLTIPQALAALVVLGGFMASFQLLGGFGVGFALLAAWLAAGLAAGGSGPPTVPRVLIGLLGFWLLLLLYRLFATRFAAGLAEATLADHYAVFGFLLGALLPSLLAGLLPAGLTADLSPAGRLVRLGLAAVGAVVAPGLLVLLWGPKTALALLVGLALSAVWGRMQDRRATLVPLLLALLTALAMTQWAGHLLPLFDLPRGQKLQILAAVMAVLFIVTVATSYGGRRVRREEAR